MSSKSFKSHHCSLVLRLDSIGVTEYVGLHGVCTFGHCFCPMRESHNLGCGILFCGTQPTLPPEI